MTNTPKNQNRPGFRNEGNTPENYKPINFLFFRQEYQLTAQDARIIIRELGLGVVRDGMEQYIVGSNQYLVSNEYFLKHGVMEYRATMRVDKTKSGEFIEYEIDTKDGIGYVGVHAFDKDAVKPITPSIKREPNKQSPTMLVAVNKEPEIDYPDRGAELMMRNKAVAPDALQVLVGALVEAQKAATPPDTLYPQKTLLEAEQQGFLLTTEQLGHLLGMTKGTISSKKSGFIKLGFRYEKVKEGASTLWKISR